MRGRTAALALVLTGFCARRARRTRRRERAGRAPVAVRAATPAETQAAAAQRAAQEAEAQVIELRRQLDALERQRAGYDDVRRRLDQLDARQRESDRRAAAGEANPPETSVVRFRDDGFDIRSPDNGFYLHPMVRVQAIYTGAVASQGPQDPAPPDLSGFSLGRAEMILEGHVGGPFFQYRLQLDAAASPSLKDAYVAWHPRADAEHRGEASSRSPTGCSGSTGRPSWSSSTSRRRWPRSRWSAISASCSSRGWSPAA